MASKKVATIADPVAETDWTGPEKWAWGEIVAGRVADFSGALDPKSRNGWTAERTLRAAFLRAILFERQWVQQVPSEGVRIVGARCGERLDLAHARLGWPLCLERCRFERKVDLGGLRSDSRLSLRRSAFCEKDARRSLSLDRCAIGPADLSGIVLTGDLAAAGARFAGPLDLTGAQVHGEIDLKRAKLDCLFFRNGLAGAMAMRNCRVDQDLDLSGLNAKGNVDMEAIAVGQDLSLGGSETRGSSFRQDIVLQAGSISGNLNLCGTIVRGAVKMNGLEVRKNLFMRVPVGEECLLVKGEAEFLGPIDMSFVEIQGHFELSRARFRSTVDMTSIQIGENLHVLGRTEFRGPFNMNSASIKGDALILGTFFRDEFQAIACGIDGNFTFNGARFRKSLNLADARIGGHLFMDDLEEIDEGKRRFSGFSCKGELILTAVGIGGQWEIQGNVHGPLTAWGLNLGRLMIQGRSRRKRPVGPIFKGSVDLSYAISKGTINLNAARFDAGLTLQGIRVGQNLMLQSRFCWAKPSPPPPKSEPDPIAPTADVSAATIAGQITLNLPSPATAACFATSLDLRDSNAGSLQVSGPEAGAEGWPARGSLQLDGFRYDRLGGFGVRPADEMGGRSPKWFKQWLGLDDPYSPQPYEQLASVLRQTGDVGRANRVLHAGRERARTSAWSWRRPFHDMWGAPRRFGFFLLKVLIGYGIGLRFFYALLWASFATAIGVWMLGPDPVGVVDGTHLTGTLQKIVYSFDQLLPIIDLDKSLSDVKLPPEVASYFWFHRLFGFLLGGFITAGIAGLTQRSRS